MRLLRDVAQAGEDLVKAHPAAAAMVLSRAEWCLERWAEREDLADRAEEQRTDRRERAAARAAQTGKAK